MVVEEVFFLLKVKHKKALAAALVLAVAASAFFAGCGSKSQKAGSGATAVKAMKVLQQDAPLTTEYAGTIAGKDEVKVQSKVSGNVVEKYVQGGETVRAGQPLYRIDSRQYQAAVLQAQATLARSQATLANAQTDLGRDESLYASNAVPEQTLTTQQTTVATYAQAAAGEPGAARQGAGGPRRYDDLCADFRPAGRR
jgi:membrane fusion protein (multidrug efflux system)